MFKIHDKFLVLFMLGFLLGIHSAAQSQGLLQKSDFTYVGSFRMPGGDYGMTNGTFSYASGTLAGTVYNDPVHGKTIFATGYLSAGYLSSTVSVAQMAIPTLKNANTVGLSGLNAATVVQGFADPSNGKGAAALVGGGTPALVCYGGKIMGTENTSYDGGCEQTKSAWVGPINFSQASQATGPYTLSSSLSPRLLGGGYMTIIPQEWQAALGGKVVSGNGPWSIISCGSPGPSLHVIDADLLLTQPNASTPIPIKSLIYYQDGIHSSLGDWDSNDPDQVIDGKTVPSVTVTDPHGRGTFTIAYEDNSMRLGGVLFAEGTRSVLFFGHKGLGPYCYGTGGTGGHCYDPENSDKGDHAYPYSEFVWAYDVNDLIAAKNGQKEPWNVLPYTGWIPDFPEDNTSGSQVGVAWDAETRLVYMSVGCAVGDCLPVVHVFSVADKSSVIEEGEIGDSGISIVASPNPFNPVVKIVTRSELKIGSSGKADIAIYTVDGTCKYKRAITCSQLSNGVTWDASSQPSGAYIVRVQSGNRIVSKVITLMK